MEWSDKTIKKDREVVIMIWNVITFWREEVWTGVPGMNRGLLFNLGKFAMGVDFFKIRL